MSCFTSIIDCIRKIFYDEDKIEKDVKKYDILHDRKHDRIYDKKLYDLIMILRDRFCCYFNDTEKNLMINLNKDFWTLKYVFYNICDYDRTKKLNIKYFCSNYDMFMWAMHTKYRFKYDALYFLNDIGVIKYCNKERDMGYINFLRDKNNVKECMNFLLHEKFIITSRTLYNAIKSDKIYDNEIMELFEKNYKYEKENFYRVIEFSSLENIKWFYENVFCNFDYNNDMVIMRKAVFNRKLKMLKI